MEVVAKHLAKNYEDGRLLDGLILLHPASQGRVTGSERDRIELLQDIVGKDAYKRVIIASTMWDNIVDKALAEKQEP